MNPASKDIKDLLSLESDTDYDFGVNLFVGKEPAMPNNCITIFDTPGFPPQLNLNNGERYEYPSVQIRIRNSAYLAGFSIAEKIKELLHGIGQITINGTFYSLISVSSTPALLDWDEKERCRFIINVNIQRR